MEEKGPRLVSRRHVIQLAVASACGVAVSHDSPVGSAITAFGWLQDRLRTHVVHKLAAAFSSKIPDYAIHSKRVAAFSVALCQILQLDADETKTIGTAALLHDIGLVAVPESILCKPSKLTEDEMSRMRQHCRHGFEMLSETELLSKEAQIVYAHHENFAGSGYPRGLKDDGIPLGAHIIRVADNVAVMTENVPAWSRARAFRSLSYDLSRWSERVFDPAIVAALLSKPMSYWMGLATASA